MISWGVSIADELQEVCDVALAAARDQRADKLIGTAVAPKKEVVSTKEKHAWISESLAHLERDTLGSSSES